MSLRQGKCSGLVLLPPLDSAIYALSRLKHTQMLGRETARVTTLPWRSSGTAQAVSAKGVLPGDLKADLRKEKTMKLGRV